MPQTLFYKPGKAPNADEREAKEIVLFLERELNALSQAFTELYLVRFRELHEEPARPRDGMFAYADGANWDPGYGEGHYGRVADSWVPANAEAAIASDVPDMIDAAIVSDVPDMIDAAIAAIPAPTPACFSVHKNGTDQTGVADATFTLVTWPVEVYDVGGYFASNGWTPPAGKVTMNANLFMSGTTAAGALTAVDIMKNGVIFKRHHASGSYGGGGFVNIVVDDIANGTDVYTVMGYQDVTAGTATVVGSAWNSWFSGHWIGP